MCAFSFQAVKYFTSLVWIFSAKLIVVNDFVIFLADIYFRDWALKRKFRGYFSFVKLTNVSVCNFLTGCLIKMFFFYIEVGPFLNEFIKTVTKIGWKIRKGPPKNPQSGILCFTVLGGFSVISQCFPKISRNINPFSTNVTLL